MLNSLIMSLIIGLTPLLGWLRLNQPYYTYSETKMLCQLRIELGGPAHENHHNFLK